MARSLYRFRLGPIADFAHRDGCYRRHNCLSDRDAYVCGDIGRLTPAQRVWIAALEQCPGVEACVWRPGDWKAIVSRLQSRDEARRGAISRHQSERKL